jgi:hypothetical protein
MKRTLSLLTLLNVVMMIAGITSVLADDRIAVVPTEPSALLLVLAGTLGIAGISVKKK